jgi:hypothetical protein
MARSRRKPAAVPPTPAPEPQQEQEQAVGVPVSLLQATLAFLDRTPGTYTLLRAYEAAGILTIGPSSNGDAPTE